METHLIFKYQPPPDVGEQDTITLLEFRVEPGSGMQIPVSGEVVTLPVERHLGEQEEGHKEYRVVRRSYVFAGREGEISTQYIDVIVTEPEE